MSDANAGCLSFLREFPSGARIVTGIPQLIDDLGLATAPASAGATALAGATITDLGGTAATVAAELVDGRATVDELVAHDPPPGRDDPRDADPARAAGARGRGVRAVSTRRPVGGRRTSPLALLDAGDGPDARLPRSGARCYPHPRSRPPRDRFGPLTGPAQRPSPERLLRKLAIALLAVPVLTAVYATAALGRSVAARTGLAVGLGALIAFGVIAVMRPSATVANPPSVPLPLTAAAFRTTITTDRELDEPVTIEFNAAMDRESVASALAVDPPVDVALTWAADGRTLTVAPTERWSPATYHTVTVDAGALAATGAPMSAPARAAFLTREPSGARILATELAGKRVTVDTAFDIAFERAVDPASVASAIRIEPAVKGAVRSRTGQDGLVSYTFTPTKPLRQGTRYTISVDGVRDADGVAVAPATATVRTIASPSVVRFRPRALTRDVTRDARHLGPLHATHGSQLDTLGVQGERQRQGDLRQGDLRRGRPRAAVRPEQDPALWHEGLDACRRFGQEQGRRDARGDRPGLVQDREQAGAARHDRWLRWVGWIERRLRWRCGGWRQLGIGRDLLPAAHELHPDRRLGHLGRPVQQPGRAQRRPAQARQGDQHQGRSAVRQAAGRRQRLQPLHRREPRRSARVEPDTPTTPGPRTSAAAPVVPDRPCSARTGSSRARSRTTAATTST